jgi:hypothetical protein
MTSQKITFLSLLGGVAVFALVFAVACALTT